MPVKAGTGSQQKGKTPSKDLDANARSIPTRFNLNAGIAVVLMAAKGLTKDGVLGAPFALPAPPLEDFTVEESYDHTEYDTIGRRRYSRPSSRGLRTVSFNTLVADAAASWQFWHKGAEEGRSNSSVTPESMVEELQELMRTGTPFEFYAGLPAERGDWDLDMLATLRSVSVVERAGEPDAKYISLAFSEYPDKSKVSRRKRGKQSQGSRTGGKVKTVSYVYVDRDGDAVSPDHKVNVRAIKKPITLAKIAREHYGSSSKWGSIRRANGNTLKGLHANDDIAAYLRKKGGGARLKITVPADPDNAREQGNKPKPKGKK